VRGWLVHLRETRSGSTARGWFAGVRHFCRWLQSEGETDRDATAGIRDPRAGRSPRRRCCRMRSCAACLPPAQAGISRRAGTTHHRAVPGRRAAAVGVGRPSGRRRRPPRPDRVRGRQSEPPQRPPAIAPSRSGSRRPGRWAATSASADATRTQNATVVAGRPRPVSPIRRRRRGDAGASRRRGRHQEPASARLPPHLGTCLPGRRRQRGRPDAPGRLAQPGHARPVRQGRPADRTADAYRRLSLGDRI
jgi:hypothetical protein